MKKQILFSFLMLLPLMSSSAVEIDNIVYELDKESKTAKVTRNFDYGGDIVIPESIIYEETEYVVNCISDYAFSGCSSLTSITIPNSVISINNKAFEGCISLSTITIPSGVDWIGADAFANCTGLSSVTVLCSPSTVWAGVFEGSSNIKEITFDCEVITAFTSGIRSAEKVILKEGVKVINEGVFEYYTGLKSIVIPNSVVSIDRWAFRNCSALSSLTIPSSVESIGDETFSGCTGLLSVNVLCSLNSYGKDVFSNCYNLKEISFDCEKVTPVFRNVSSIDKINLTENVTSIGMQAFYGCSGINSIILPHKLTIIESEAFAGCNSIKSVIIPNSVTYIGWGAFQGCGNLSSVVIGSGVTTMDGEVFNSSNIKKMIWLTNTPPSGSIYTRAAVNYVSNDKFDTFNNPIIYPFLSSYFEADGIIYVPVSPSARTCDAIDCVYAQSSEKTKISPTVTYQGVTMNVLNVQPYVCFNNSYIKEIKYEMAGNIPDYSFTKCENAQKIILGDKTDEFDIFGCYIGANISKIGNNVFENCKLSNIIIADSYDELIIGSNDTSPLFSDCPIDSVYIGRNINYNTSKDHGYSPFYRNTTLRAVKITDKETEISENEFYGCTNLQRVIIGDGVTTIGNWAFSGCSSLKFFTFGSEVKTIGQEAFSDCSAVTEITSRAIVPPTCGNQALDDINKWECKLYVPIGHLKAYQEADQWKDFFFAEEGDYNIAAKYTLTYMVDGEVYKTYQVAEGSTITPEEEPTKPDYIFSGWDKIPTTMPSEDVTITGTFSQDITEKDVITIKDTGKGTWCSEYDLDFTNVEGIKAYTATGYDDITKTIWVTRVYTVPAGTGIMVKGDPGEYKIPHAKVRSYYANLFKGNTGSEITIYETDGEWTNYYMSKGQFVSVSGNAKIGKNRCYLQLPTSVFAGTRSIGIVYDDEEEGTTGIMDNGQWIMDNSSDQWYTLSGQRISQPTKKGLYIHNGRKVIIR